MARRTVDPQQSFPELEEEVLARWRERDVFHESIRRREGAEPWVFWEGPPTANGRPGVHHVLARVFKDIYPRYKTMRGYHVERKGGWDMPRAAGRDRRPAAAGHREQARDRDLRDRRVQPALPRVGLRVPRGLERADRAHRLLDRPRRRLPHARPDATSSRSGGRCARSTTRGCSTRATRSCPTARAAARRSPATRWRRATRTSSTRASTSACRCRGRRPAAGRRRAARVDHDAVDAGLQRGGRGRPRAHLRAREGGAARCAGRRSPRRWSSACSAPKACGSSSASPAPRSTACATSRPSPISSPTPTASAATRSCSATSSPPTTAPASCTPRSPSARTTSASASSTG